MMYDRRLFVKLTNFIHDHAEAEMNSEVPAPGAVLGRMRQNHERISL